MSHILDFVSLSPSVIIYLVSLSLIFWGNGISLYRILLLVGSSKVKRVGDGVRVISKRVTLGLGWSLNSGQNCV